MELKAWREVIAPNDDVAFGQYDQSEFAADLAQVAKGKGSSEYSDPQKFFLKTYLTGGLKSLLVNVMRRLSVNAGDPIIQMKTSFGGGKTHSLLALYHLFGGKIRAEQSSAVREVLDAAKADFIPKVHTATVVGTMLNPLDQTIWGEISAQLARSTGKPELHDMMRDNDMAGISPGREMLQKMFAEAGTCLILLDELVLYGRKLTDNTNIGRCTVGNLISFMQELTEAVKASARTALVVSLPSSKIEVGDEQGEKILASIENVFGRMESLWSAATAEEGYEIIRRRLFKDCSDPKAREETCEAFFKMYERRRDYFPSDSRQKYYKERLLSCYPIHPQLFDFFYEKWTGLEKFQKTRGVLRLMAKVLHNLWMTSDNGAMILPSDIPLCDKSVRDELTKLLKGNWGSIVDAEVDGDGSKAFKLDESKNKFGKFKAARKISRTIFMGTAPSSRESMVRGLDDKEIRLGTIQPADAKNIPAFNDALSALKGSLYYLYSQNDRLWFGVNPTLRKFVDDKRETYTADDIEYEIEKQINTWKHFGDHLKAVHVFPRGSADIPEDKTVHLVIISSKFAYTEGIGNNAATVEAEKILRNRGSIPRKHQNMLLFMAADAERLKVLDDAAREYMAWRDVMKEDLNLDDLIRKDGNNNRDSAEKTFEMKVSQAYRKILAPYTDDKNVGDIRWQVDDINCFDGKNFQAAEEKFMRNENLLASLGANALKRLLDEHNLWGEDDSVDQDRLGEYFLTYCYLPRLVDRSALFGAINRGAQSNLFSLADNVLYKEPPIAQQPIDDKPKAVEPVVKSGVEVERDVETAEPAPSEPEEKPLSTYFYMDKELNITRLNKDVNNVKDAISLLLNINGADISVRLSVTITADDGIEEYIKEIVADNCKKLGIDFGFEE